MRYQRMMHLCELVKSVQKHTHSVYCRKKGCCRFKFPRPPSARTLLARETDDDELGQEKLNKAQILLTKVHEVLTNDDTPADISFDDLLALAKTNEKEYMEALSVSKKVPMLCYNDLQPSNPLMVTTLPYLRHGKRT